MKKSTPIQKVYFKYASNFERKFASLESLLQVYTFEFGNKYISFESLLQVYFSPRKEIQMHFKNRFKTYLKYTSLLHS